MASPRLRKTFQYPSDADSEDEPTDLDEQEQEELITSLHTRDESSNLFYQRAFLSLPLLSTLVYLPALVFALPARQVLLAFLSISSLLCTAYILHFIPPRAASNPDSKGKRPLFRTQAHPDGPIEEYLPWLNAALSSIMALAAVLAWRKGLLDEALRNALPAAVFVVVVIARRQMAPLDIAELERLRYEYKGA